MILLVGITAGWAVHTIWGEDRLRQVRGGGGGGVGTEDYDYDAIADDDQQQQDNVDVQAWVDNVLSFSPNAFFVALLPPIIFNSGYHLQKELFFRHLLPIALLAVVGTLASTLIVAISLKLITLAGLQQGNAEGEDFVPTFSELLTFGALISATDPVSTLAVFQAKRVDPQLFYLVFGESVLNDAVGLVLFETFRKFVQRDNGAGKIAMGFVEFLVGFSLDAVASPLLGWFCALGAAYLFKVVDFRHNVLLELALFLLIMYVPFMIAELLQLSSIVTILVTGIAARHYVEPNLSTTTQDTADVLFRLAAHLAETSIFLELGLSVVGVTDFMEWRFIGWSLLMCLIARACHVYPIALLHNKSLRQRDSTKEGISNSGCNCCGYNLHKRAREGIDGLMRMEPRQVSKRSCIGDDADESDNDAKVKRVVKPLSGNLELAEHLNDFSPQSSCEDRRLQSQDQRQQEKSMTEKQSIDPEKPSLAESPAIVRTDTASSEGTLTPAAKRDMKIQSSTAHMVWFSGLRGAVAYACVRSFPDTFDHQRQFMCTTMMIVLITVFAMGGATEFVLERLKIEMNVNEDEYMASWRHSEHPPTPGVLTYIGK